MIPLILDTDIGPDVDDVGAVALLHILSRETPTRILAMTHCTSNPFGAGCLDAINRYYGQDIPVGTLSAPGFLVGPETELYNRHICETYPNRFRPGSGSACPDANDLLRRTLAAAEDHSVEFVAIGPLPNLARLVGDPGGRDLVARKVRRLVAMAGAETPDPEWNVLMDIPAAREVFRRWPTPIVLTPFETGRDILTGRTFGSMREGNPVRVAYTLHSPEGRMSWDLTAIWFALRGTEPFFERSGPLSVTVHPDGRTEFTEDPDGQVRLLRNRMSPDAIGLALDALWTE